VGPQAIRAAFERLFASGRAPAFPERVHRLQTLQTAVHGVIERVQLPGPGAPRGAWVLATNVYFKTAQGWRLVAHHASPGRPSEAPDADEAPAVLH
jgi:ketosteroid isomerase-like protein